MKPGLVVTMSLALKFQILVRGLKPAWLFMLHKDSRGHPSVLMHDQNTWVCPKVEWLCTSQSALHTRVFLCRPILTKEGFSNFSELFLIHVRLADSLNRFVNLRIKTAFCSNPHNKPLSNSHYIGVYYSWEFFFCYVIISSIPKSEISSTVL